MFLNKFAGRSPLLDRSVELLSDTFLLTSIPLVALLWLIWFKDKREESRIGLLMGVLQPFWRGFLSRLLQLVLPFHVRPLYNAALKLTWPTTRLALFLTTSEQSQPGPRSYKGSGGQASAAISPSALIPTEGRLDS